MEGRSQVARDENKKKEVVDLNNNCLDELNVMRLKKPKNNLLNRNIINYQIRL